MITIGSGWLSDRIDPRILLVVYYALRGSALIALPVFLGPDIDPPLLVIMVFFGLDWVATVPPTALLCGRIFGPERGPIVFGWVFASHMVGAGISGIGLGHYLVTMLPGKNFAIVDAAMNDLLRPALYSAWHPVDAVRPRTGDERAWDVVGPVCESGDFLALDRRLALAPGDLLAVGAAGAYGMAMSSNYNARPRACEVMVDGAAMHVVRRRERVGQSVLPLHRGVEEQDVVRPGGAELLERDARGCELLEQAHGGEFNGGFWFPTMSGMFANPSYGGNDNKVGWKLVGFDDKFSWQAPFGYYDRV